MDEVVRIVKKNKSKGKTIALITGCFDIVHIKHIELFRFAKKNADIVVVGLENDETIRLSKGEGRPIYKLEYRARVLSDLKSIDLIFPIETVFNFGNKSAGEIYQEITKRIKPNYLVTNPLADKYWKEKERRAKDFGARLLKNKRPIITSSTAVIRKLESEP